MPKLTKEYPDLSIPFSYQFIVHLKAQLACTSLRSIGAKSTQQTHDETHQVI